jgi:hypothetical protein
MGEAVNFEDLLDTELEEIPGRRRSTVVPG